MLSLSYSDCSIRVYDRFTENCYINVFYILPIMLALCLTLSLTHYVQNYAGIISGSLQKIQLSFRANLVPIDADMAEIPA